VGVEAGSPERWFEKALFMAINYSYNSDMKVSVADAKNKLPKLIRAAEQGQRVTICRHGKPVVDMVRTAKSKHQKPKLGTLRGRIVIHDPDWWKPMTDEEVDEFLGNGK
jgi:prevent-host-death family protein